MYRFAIASLALLAIALSLGQVNFGSTRAMLFLAGSGVVGVAIGEAALFQAVFLLGPRRSSLIFTLHAPLTALIGSVLFRETVTPSSILGVTLAFVGVYAAVIFRSQTEQIGGTYHKPDVARRGFLMVALAVICQVCGALLAKEVIDDVRPLFASFTRTFAATIAFIPIFLTFKKSPHSEVKSAMRFVFLSALVSTIGGMNLLLAALASTEIFRAIIISSLSPMIYILLMSLARKERFSFQAWVGTIVAVIGVAITVLA